MMLKAEFGKQVLTLYETAITTHKSIYSSLLLYNFILSFTLLLHSNTQQQTWAETVNTFST